MIPGEKLDHIYDQVRTAVGSTVEDREVSSLAYGGALVLVVAAAGLSLLLTGRPT